jgi:hypothetical protein
MVYSIAFGALIAIQLPDLVWYCRQRGTARLATSLQNEQPSPESVARTPLRFHSIGDLINNHGNRLLRPT